MNTDSICPKTRLNFWLENDQLTCLKSQYHWPKKNQTRFIQRLIEQADMRLYAFTNAFKHTYIMIKRGLTGIGRLDKPISHLLQYTSTYGRCFVIGHMIEFIK